MPDTGIEDIPQEELQELVDDCNRKYDEYVYFRDEYAAAYGDWVFINDQAEQANQSYTDSFAVVDRAKAELDAAKRDRDAGHCDDERYREIEERLSEINAIDPDTHIDRLTRIVTGEASGDVDDAWSQMDYYLGLRREKSELEAEKAALDSCTDEELQEAVDNAEIALKTAKEDQKTKYQIYMRWKADATQAFQYAYEMYASTLDAYTRYIQYGCDGVTPDNDIEKPVKPVKPDLPDEEESEEDGDE